MLPRTLSVVARRLAPVAIAVAIAAAAFQTLASTAANTTISNVATVSYQDAGGNPLTPVTATAVVTVTLVPSAVSLSSPPAQTIPQGTSATLTYVVTSTANGPDSYNLTSVATPSNLSASTPALPPSIALGGTTLASAANNGDTSITVPYDGVAGATVNGIAVGGIVVVGANAYTVTSIVKNAGNNTVAIGLGSAIAGGSVAAGQIVGERKTFVLTEASGNVTTGGSGTQTVSTTATSAASAGATVTQSTPTVITVNRPTLTVSKLVSVDGGSTFAATGNAAPGTSLIYKIVATNGGSTPASSVAFTDVIPAYLTYVPGTAKFATASGTSYALATALSEGAGGYGYNAGTRTVSYDPGGATGSVAGGGELVLFFRATIN
jgi:uncharacterized repeat protein (TIGR01451 family)